MGRNPALQRLRGLHVVPRHQLAVAPEERLHREHARAGFQRAVGADEPFTRVEVAPHHGPRRGLAQEAARIQAAPRLLRQVPHERFLRLRPRQRLHLQLADRRRQLARHQRDEPQPCRLRLGHVELVATAVAAGHVQRRAPVAVATVQLHQVLARARAGQPVDRQAAELLLAAEVERERGRRLLAARQPPRVRVAVQGKIGRLVVHLRTGLGHGHGHRPAADRQRHQPQVVDPHAARAAAARRHRDLDRLDAPQRLVAAVGPPGEAHLALLRAQVGPLGGNRHVATHVPVHVLARLVDQLQFQVLRLGVAAQAVRDGVVLGQGQVDIAPRNGPAAAAEHEVHAQRALVGHQVQLHAVGRRRRPGGDRAEVVDQRIALVGVPDGGGLR
jgi:hypothetical protein